MILVGALMRGLGMSYGAWIARDGEVSDYFTADFYKDMARAAEAGKLHALFLAEQLTGASSGTERPSGGLDVSTVLATMAAVTTHIGVVGTASTTYNQPYDLARRFGTLDHLTRGRVGWNVVTTTDQHAARAFGADAHPGREDRYDRADEFLEVAFKLWHSWGDGALVGDKAGRVFARADLVEMVDHEGKHFNVHARLPFPRSPQVIPAIFQAGASPQGRDLAAKYSDVVFTAQHTTAGAVEFRQDIRRRAAEFGREPDSVKVLPGMAVILGATEAEARRRKEELDDAAGIEWNLKQLSGRIGLPVEVLELDRPLRTDLLVPDEEFKGSVGFRRSLVNLAVSGGLTVRQLIKQTSGAIHQQVVGTPEQVADAMQERIDAGAADGFTIMIDMLPSGLNDLVSLLVPELQSRGLLHETYEHDTLRANLGIPDYVGVDAALT
jgi:FMN-dependent oxidoreductase (nitrilotriacetate monooxygenase family)